MGLTEQQEKAATAEGSVTITAGAGTGKTYMLAERYLFHLKAGLSPLEVVAMTFTDKAATELRSRIRQTVTAQAQDRLDWLAELETAPICTFHSLAARICREHPEAAGVPADFTPLDEWEGKLWQAEQVTIALEQLPDNLYAQVPYSLMRSAIEAFLQDPLSAEKALTRSQQDWLPILKKTQEKIIEALINHDFWLEAKEIVRHNAGQSGDRLELVRQNALELIEQIEHHAHDVQGNHFQATLQTWLDFKVGNVGSKKNWQSEEILKQVRRILIDWRDFTKDFSDIALLTIQVGAIDFQAEEMIPILQEAFAFVRSHLTEAKRKQRVLDFNDLEVHALQALEKPYVQDYYHRRLQAFLIDEFQDTNPTQGKLLEILTQNATLTLVGDEKQSIYGFRRADIEVFKTWRDRLKNTLPLNTSFRTHNPLIQNINQLFAPILEDLHQDLNADRLDAPHPAPHVEIFVLAADAQVAYKPSVDQCRQAEAQHIADLVQTMLQERLPIWDKKTKEHRPIQFGDIAILSRTWKPLNDYGQAIAERVVDEQPIPILQAGGGNLLDTREAKDAFALLQFLADSRDNISLVAVLKSPFFALSDRLLLNLRQSSTEENTNWWQILQQAEQPEFTHAIKVLKELRNSQSIDPPSRLLQLADQLTGYTAVIANLPNHQRRLADWRGFLDIVRKLETGTAEVFMVVRRLKRIVKSQIEIERPPLEAVNAVTLMTIHSAKGLEWSVVIIPNLSGKSSGDHPLIRFDPTLGVALKPEDDEGEKQKSALYLLLEQRQKQREKDEMKRLLYVAATRARDRLILTTTQGKNELHLWNVLQPGLQGPFIPQEVLFDPENLKNSTLVDPPLPDVPPYALLNPIRSGGLELPITALTDYARCPQGFYYKYIEGYPGEVTGTGNYGREVGILTHRALAQGIETVTELQKYNSSLSLDKVQEALDLADTFRRSPTYSSVQNGVWEQFLSFKLGSIVFNGSADLIGDDFILDIKTDQEVKPQEHRFQVWAYAKAAKKSQAYLAYLRHDDLMSFSKFDLRAINQEAKVLVKDIENRNYTAKPSLKTCLVCLYNDICKEKFDDF
ncbi:MAG: UvrD-helicase domain-containing protein [Snowella sp.]|nr:UvrD-helicase domain-containing protein [Snowella sp.]